MKATMENLILENQRLRQEMLQKGMQLPPIPKGLKHYQMLQYIESSSDSDRKRTFVYTCVLWHNIIRGEMCNFAERELLGAGTFLCDPKSVCWSSTGSTLDQISLFFCQIFFISFVFFSGI